ncbi:hypothetical protein BDB00DRAFT_771930, partial [Zychaea mexicana]|uniref:uncharacterized protein n=1 Tax=Zychaea mexicana TaxID=64656 RepID=UPI0022FEC13B
DPMDPCWSEYFTKEEIQEIRMHNAPQLQELPEGLQAYLRVFANKHVLEDLVELHLRHRFHPSKVDERWAEKAIGEVLDLYYYSYNFFNKTENDLLRRLWIFIEKCFDESVFEVVSGEKASTASSERKNDERSLPGTTAIPRKTVDAKVDILVRHLEHEYAAGEAGVSGGVTCTKFVVESNLKLPKTLKDIIWSLSKRSPGKIRSIRVPGFVINGTELAIKIMDLPRGNVCRLYSFAAMEFPLTAETFYKGFVPLLTLVWQCKSLLKATLKSVQEDDDMFIPTIEMLSRQPTIPACMTSPRSKKRKAVEKDE